MKKLLSICTVLCAVLLASCDLNQDPPQLTVESNGQIVAEFEGGQCTFSYELLNPANDGVLSLEIPAGNDWITNPVIDEASKYVTITLAENKVKEARNEILTLKYTYGGENVTAMVSILQKESLYDYISTCTSGGITYYGPYASNNGAILYYLNITNSSDGYTQPNTQFYNFDLYLNTATEDMLPLPGTYDFITYGEESNFHFTEYNSFAEFVGEDVVDYEDYMSYEFTGGTVEVAREGDIFTIKAVVTDVEGAVHCVKFEGELEVYDLTDLSSLDGDYDLDITGKATIWAINYGDYYGMELINWYLNIYPDDMASDGIYFLIDALAPMDVLSFTEPIIWESYNTAETDYFFIPGSMGGGYTYFHTIDYYDEESNFLQTKHPSAALIEGFITVTPNADGTANLSTDAYDEDGNKISIHGTNLPLEYLDYSQSTSVMALPAQPKVKINRVGEIKSVRQSLRK